MVQRYHLLDYALVPPNARHSSKTAILVTHRRRSDRFVIHEWEGLRKVHLWVEMTQVLTYLAAHLKIGTLVINVPKTCLVSCQYSYLGIDWYRGRSWTLGI
jgi:hypothetical protein